MPKLYSSKDAGLPAFYISGASSLQRFNNYKLILKACLVTGYGARLAAGWTLVDEGDQYLVLRNASGNYVTISSGYYVDSTTLSAHGVFRVFLHATYAGMGANGVPLGSGVVSGTAGGVALPVFFGTDLLYWEVGSRWMVAADDRTFIFSMNPATTTNPAWVTGTNIDTQSGCGTLYVGDDLGGNHIAAGGQRLSSPPGGQIQNFFDRLAFTTLRNPKTGLLVDGSAIACFLDGAALSTNAYTSHGGTAGITNSTDVLDMTTLEMGQVRWIADGQPQAGLRGIRREHLLARHYSNWLRRSLEGSSTTTDYSVDNIFDAKPLSDGYSYLPLIANREGRGALIITDNPAYW